MRAEHRPQALAEAPPGPAPGLDEPRRTTLWAHSANLALGAWLLSAPATLGYRSEALS
jgi:hypothetical protein